MHKSNFINAMVYTLILSFSGSSMAVTLTEREQCAAQASGALSMVLYGAVPADAAAAALLFYQAFPKNRQPAIYGVIAALSGYAGAVFFRAGQRLQCLEETFADPIAYKSSSVFLWTGLGHTLPAVRYAWKAYTQMRNAKAKQD